MVNPRVVYQSDQIVPTGKFITLDLSRYFNPRENETFTYHLEKGPVGLTLEANTGLLKGVTPLHDMDQTYLVHFSAESSLAKEMTHIIFDLIVTVNPVILGGTREQALLGLSKEELLSKGSQYESELFTQYFINNYLLYIQIQNATFGGIERGNLLNNRESATGWSVFEYDNCLIVSPGKLMFAEGNRGRLIHTLREVYLQDLPKRNWPSILILGSDVENVGRAWVVAKEMDLPVTEVAPHYIAEVNLSTLERMRRGFS